MVNSLLCGTTFAVLAAGPTFAETPAHTFKAVGTWSNFASWQELEQPFWSEKLPAASGGKLADDAIPLTEVDLKGNEVMRLLNLDVFEVAHGLGSYVAAENPAIEGVDLSSIAPDFATMRAITDAYSITFSAINATLWYGHDEETRATMTAAFKQLEYNGWANAEAKEALGVACLASTSSGSASCAAAGDRPDHPTDRR